MNGYSINDKCVGCTLCAKSCPVAAISGSLKEQHAIDPEKCVRCGLCGRLCPKGAVLDETGATVEKLAKNQWPAPWIDDSLCAGCSVCVENCPKRCLDLTEPQERGDIHTIARLARPADCIGCGLCAASCPIGAITMRKPGAPTPPKYINTTKEGSALASIPKTLFCRGFQLGMKVGNYVLGYRMPEYLEGPGSIAQLPQLLRSKGADHVLIVTDSNLIKLGLPDKMLDALKKDGFHFTVFSDLAVNPTSADVEAGYKVYRENRCQALVAFGGGAPMDCAKAIAAKAVHPNRTVSQLQGVLKVHRRIPLFFAIPTTAGTGSETTVAAVITDAETHHKASINDPCIIPRYAILDPELTVGLPPFVTATTGMDALCHAVEAYTNHSYNTPLEDLLSKEAVRLIRESLLTAYHDGSDLSARQNMQKAAFFAGRAFTRGCVGYVHAVGHTLGGLYGVPHGLAMSVILPHVMRQFGPAVYRRLSELADVCGIRGENEEQKALAFIDWIEDLQKEMGIPSGFDCIRDEDIPQIIAWANAEANPLYPVPVVWDERDFRRLIVSIRKK